MTRAGGLLALRYLLVCGLVTLMAAASSGLVSAGMWGGFGETGEAVARGLPVHTLDFGRTISAADNGPVCDPRPSPHLQTVTDASGALQVTIAAAIASDGEAALLREIRIGPLQNAAVDVGSFVARTAPLAYAIPGGSRQVVLRVTRVVASQPSHITLVLVDDCGEWHTFVGGGTGVTVTAPAATATPVPVVPGQPYGSIPIALTITGSAQSQYPPGSRPRAQVTTRPGPACTLSVTWPDGRSETLPALTADAQGACLFRPTVPVGMRSGTATAIGTVQDIFGFNIQQTPFLVGGTIGPGDNISSVDPFDDNGDVGVRGHDDNTDTVGDNDGRGDNLDDAE